MNCPACGSDMRSKSLISADSFKPYRVCPDCQSKYTTDKATKGRAALIAVLALMTFGLAGAAFELGFPWGLAALAAGTGLLFFAGYSLSRITYVKYRDDG